MALRNSQRYVFTSVVLFAAFILILWSGWSYLFDGQAPYGDDNSAHLALMMHIAELWRAGVTDLWWNQSNLGLPLFMAYQPLPGLVSGTLGAFVESTESRILIFKSTIVVLWALMPAAWYIGGRWLGMKRLTALFFGLLTLAIRDIHDVGFGFTAATYGGLYTQVWGMFFFPMTVGAFRKYVIDREFGLPVPVALFVVLSMSHLFCGMYAGIATLVWIATAKTNHGDYFKKALLVYLSALALLAFWLGPLLATREFVGGLPWKNEYYNGWPIVELFHHILGGDVFDDGRVPWLTMAFVSGTVLAVQNTQRWLYRWGLLLTALTLVLFMGRTNLGQFYNWLPMHTHINVMRYMNGIHFCGLVLAAAAFGTASQYILRKVHSININPPQRRYILIGVFGLLFAIYGYDRFSAFHETLATFNQQHPTVTDLVDHLQKHRDQRIYVSDELNTTAHFYRDLIPALAGRGQVQSYALGYHATLSTYYAEYLEYNETSARLFNTSDFVAKKPLDRTVVSQFRKTFENDLYAVYRPPGADTFEYFDFIRTPITIQGDYRDIRPGVREILLPAYRRGILPELTGPTTQSNRKGVILVTPDAVNSVPHQKGKWKSKVKKWTDAEPRESTILSTARGFNWYRADVKAKDETEKLMLKVNYFPFWNAEIDGRPVDIEHIAPNYMAIDVPPGKHRVTFTYRNPWWQKLGFIVTWLILAGGLLRSIRRPQVAS